MVGGASGYCSWLLEGLLEPNGSAITNNFDPVARLLGTYWRTNSGGLANKHEYLYNLAGQRTNETRIDGTTVAYAYDPIGQLVAATSSDSAEELGYDYDLPREIMQAAPARAMISLPAAYGRSDLLRCISRGKPWNLNWWTNSGTAHAWQVNNLNEVTNAYPEGVLTFDSNGNTLTANGTHNTFAYDGENRLTGWVYYQSGPSSPQSGDVEVLLAYDGLGRLRQRLQYVYQGSIGGGGPPPPGQGQSPWALSGGTNYFYDPGTGRPGGWRVIQERSTNGTPGVSYTWGNDLSGSLEGAGGIGGLLARSDGYSSGNWTTHNFYQADGMGNVTYMLNSGQAMVASYRYDPFGRTISQSGSLASANSYQFSSKQYDADMAMSYFGYRWYDPHLQRWPNRDPLAEFEFEAVWTSLPTELRQLLPPSEIFEGPNLYSFVSNDAITGIDAFGLYGGVYRPGKGNNHGSCPCPPGQSMMTGSESYGSTTACVRHILTSTLTGLGLSGTLMGVGGYAGGAIGAGGATGVTVGGIVGTGGGIGVGLGAAMAAAAFYCNSEGCH